MLRDGEWTLLWGWHTVCPAPLKPTYCHGMWWRILSHWQCWTQKQLLVQLGFGHGQHHDVLHFRQWNVLGWPWSKPRNCPYHSCAPGSAQLWGGLVRTHNITQRKEAQWGLSQPQEGPTRPDADHWGGPIPSLKFFWGSWPFDCSRPSKQLTIKGSDQ